MYLCIYHYHQHLNTSYVDIKQIGGDTTKLSNAYLNTSYVDIKLPFYIYYNNIYNNLNTSYVDIKLRAYGLIWNEWFRFKYILC